MSVALSFGLSIAPWGFTKVFCSCTFTALFTGYPHGGIPRQASFFKSKQAFLPVSHQAVWGGVGVLDTLFHVGAWLIEESPLPFDILELGAILVISSLLEHATVKSSNPDSDEQQDCSVVQQSLGRNH